MLKKVVENPYLNFLSGMVLFITSGYETWTSFGEESLGAHHGVLLFSLIHILKVLPDIMEGLAELEEAHEASK